MITSQFSYYSSNDVGAPRLVGVSGSLLALLDAVLVNGYGNKTSLGWLKPIPNYNDGKVDVLGCYQQPSGSKLSLFVNDWQFSGSNTSGTRDAMVVGYETVIGLTSSLSFINKSASIGEGVGAFPLTGQQQVTGKTFSGYDSGSWCWRKSLTADNFTFRPWVLFGDSRTFYLFVLTGDNGATYEGYFFGDIYSLKKDNDKYKCFLNGRQRLESGNNASYDSSDVISKPYQDFWGRSLARASGGGGFAILASMVGDTGKQNVTSQAYVSTTTILQADGIGVLRGTIPTPNPADGSIYISPIWISEPVSSTLRGRMRGMWQVCHTLSSFSDGQIIYGSNQYAGKKLQIVRPGYNNGFWAIEISATLETNDEIST